MTWKIVFVSSRTRPYMDEFCSFSRDANQDLRQMQYVDRAELEMRDLY